MKKTSLLPLAGYLLLTLIMTWPTILHLTDGIPGDGFDGWQNYWNLWWVKQAHLVEGRNPFFTDYLYPPTGVSLLFHTLNIFNGWWTLPVQLTLGLAPAYHSIVLFSFTMAGYGAYLLCLYTLNRLFPGGRGLRWAAFAGGVVFTMSPFHMAHLLGHMQVFSMIWPPFYVLWLLRTLDPWAVPAAAPPAGQWRNAIISSLFLVLAALVDWYHALYLLIFTGLVLVWMVGRAVLTPQNLKAAPDHRRAGETASDFTLYGSGFSMLAQSPLLRPFWPVLVIVLLFGLTLSPLLIPMIRDASSRADLETGLFQNITLSADLLAFFLPSELHPLWGDWATGIANQFKSTTSERLIFVGFVPLALGCLAAITLWKKTAIKFWVLITIGFFVLALGPYLHIKGWTAAINGWEIPMPYLLFYHTIPFISLTRSLSRYSLMVMLSLGVLVAIALSRLNNSGRSRAWPPFFLSGVTILLICFEFLAIPYPISKIDTPAFFFDIAAQPEAYTIAELPMDWDRPTPLLHQTTHGKRLLTAYTSRDNPMELAWRIPVFQHWRYLGPDIIDQSLERIAPTIFYDFNLRYIVLDYWQMPPGPVQEATERWVMAALPAGTTPIYDDGRLKVYQSPPKTDTQTYLSLGQGWGDRQERPDGLRTRPILAGQAQAAELFIHHPQPRPLVLEVTAAAEGEAQTLLIFSGEEQIGSVPVGPAFIDKKISLPSSEEALVKLKLAPAKPDGQILISRLGLVASE